MYYKLNVPYHEKDQAKACGARWNARERTWFYEGELPEGLKRWYREADGPAPSGEVPPAETAEEASASGSAAAGGDSGGLYTYMTVSQVNEMIRNRFQMTREFQNILVTGEVTDFDGHRGSHYYFALKDKTALLPCVMWEETARRALKFELKAGQQVVAAGSLEYYRSRGKSQLVVRRIENAGAGAANLAYLQLKARLEAEGLFDPAFKKPIPKHPEAIGIVTSKDGQAIRDICKVARKRNPYIRLVLYHVNVQGKEAVRTIVEGIAALDRMGLSTIIVGRGGGSDEELMAYNDEQVARAVFAARTPIVSAVGHEGHTPLVDFVADKRAATPTEAAEETVPDIMTDISRVRQLRANIGSHMRSQLERRRLLLAAETTALGRYSPVRQLQERRERLEQLRTLLRQNVERAVENRRHRFDVLLAGLNGLSPTAKLVKGFGYISLGDKPVTSVRDVHEGDDLRIRIHDGQIAARVTGTGTDVQ